MPVLGKRKRSSSYSMPMSKRRRTLAYVMRNPRGKGRKVTFGNGITTQRDVTNVYRKKRMPRRRRRQWVKFVRKVKAVVYKGLGTKTVLFNEQMVAPAAPNDQQRFVTVTLYGFMGSMDASDVTGNRDLYRIALNDPEIFKSGTGTSQVPVNGKLLMGSGILDMTMTNTSETAVEVDVYLIVSGMFTNNRTINDGFNDPNTPTIAGSGNGIGLNTHRGATPFDFPQVISANKLKILSKKKYFLPVGNTATYQFRDSRNHYINCSKFHEQKQPIEADKIYGPFNYPGVTKTIMIVYKSVAGATVSAQLKIGVSRMCYVGSTDILFWSRSKALRSL